MLYRFGSRGNSYEKFAGPHYAAVNSKNQIIVTDFHNHCIKLFDCEGNYLTSFGSNGEGNGQFNAPTGIAVDSQDNIIVADWGNSRIQVGQKTIIFFTHLILTSMHIVWASITCCSINMLCVKAQFRTRCWFENGLRILVVKNS